MRDGRYHAFRRGLASRKTAEEAGMFVDRFLEQFDEQDKQGKYLHPVDDWSIKALYEACEGADFDNGITDGFLTEAQGTSSFPQAITGLISKKILRSYDEVQTETNLIGKELVTDETTTKKEEKVIRLSSHPLLQPTVEGISSEPFELKEAYYGYSTLKLTREIDITDEVVMFDQTKSIWTKAKQMGRAGILTEEYAILHSIMDLQADHLFSKLGATYKVYRPSDSGTDLWSATAPTGDTTSGNLITTNALQDWTDVQNASRRLSQFLDDTPEKIKDSSSNDGKRIGHPLDAVVLVPEYLTERAWQIFASALITGAADNDPNPTRQGGPLHRRVLSSPILDAESTSTWFYGAIKRQFVRHVVYPFRLLSMNKRGSLEMMRRGIYGWVKAEMYHGIAAQDNKLVVKNTA